MNPEIKDKWIKALRSGEYKQGNGSLHQTDAFGEDRYCCLGVLCDLAKKDGVKMSVVRRQISLTSTEAQHLYDDQASWLPGQVAAWARWEGDPGFHSDDIQGQLAEMNDTKGYTFDEIADWVERNL